MPVLGNLAEFPLPEVLHFIGSRTGRMKLLDIPGADLLELDMHAGLLYALHSGGQELSSVDEVIEKLSIVLQAGRGMFEFILMDEVHIRVGLTIPLQSLAMELAFNVDKMNDESQRLVNPNSRFVLLQEPQIWLEHDLRQFYHYAKEMIQNQSTLAEIADLLGTEPRVVASHLGKLRLLGFVDFASEPSVGNMIPQKQTTRYPLPSLKTTA
ncbi:MAG: hypothetical protein B9S32_15995 [Verrucomicrobia bacterium Tous-C9LFEB]|nr:MAG: hypothetical protein B9S32_15995 [Verrucomicrobia bacterium Tous-C9LFEB]